MWEFYLAASEMAFRYDRFTVFQIQLAKRVDAVPLTRDYLYPGASVAAFPRPASERSDKALGHVVD